MTRILAIDGSYRANGVTDQVIDAMIETLRASGALVEVITLRDYPIGFCLNCRACTQDTGHQPAQCVLSDGMQELIDKIEKCDGYILAAPTNFGTVTALYKRFLERLVVYAFWPWEMNTPKYRKDLLPRKKAVLVSSCAAPGLLGRWFYNSRKQLKSTARMIGAETVGTLFTGLVSRSPCPEISTRLAARARRVAVTLL